MKSLPATGNSNSKGSGDGIGNGNGPTDASPAASPDAGTNAGTDTTREATEDAIALPPGTRIDDYEIRQWLGGGGFGITYLARDLQLDLPVALKEFFPADCAHRGPGGVVLPRGHGAEAFQAGLERFVDEARALANFRHPNIVRVLRHLRSHGTACIVMEYERGEPLTHWVARHQPLDEAALMGLMLPLLDGLAQVHAAGFLHRDIKPDNIYVRSDGQPVLLDFGAARRVLAGAAATSIVSPGFAPFEQYHSQGEQGPWSDLYALGAVMYWMVTGRKPLEAAARIQGDKQPLASQLADPERFSPGLLWSIAWAMRPLATQRPQSVAAFREALLTTSRRQETAAASVPGSSPALASSAPGPSAPLAAPPAGFPTPAPQCPPLAVLGRPPAAQLESITGRNLLACIAFIDMVAWSALSVDEQVGTKQQLNELLVRVLQGIPRERYLAMCTGDGAALCFLGDPEEALDCMLLLRDLVARRPPGNLALRIGLHLGPVRVVTDLNDRVNVLGDGINVAQRVMSFAQSRELLVSGPLPACLAPITERRAGQFRFLGQRQDKHGRVHELYTVPHEPAGTSGRPDSGQPDLTIPRTQPLRAREGDSSPPGWRAGASFERPARGAAPSSPAPYASPSPAFPSDWLVALESLLSQQIGPMARVLLRQQARKAATAGELVEALAELVDPPSARARFRQAAERLLLG